VGPHSGLAPVGAWAKPPQGDKRDEASSKSWLSRAGLTERYQVLNLSRSLRRRSPTLGSIARQNAPEPGSPMNKAQLKKFRSLLEEKRDEIVKKAKQTLDEDMTLDANDLPDEMDLASSEYLQSFTFRLRGREKSFLDKITKALAKIDDGTFGTCEECGEDISIKRLEARPETTLCIRCKEDQERMEKDYG
jgi:DnaK suppressor protein